MPATSGKRHRRTNSNETNDSAVSNSWLHTPSSPPLFASSSSKLTPKSVTLNPYVQRHTFNSDSIIDKSQNDSGLAAESYRSSQDGENSKQMEFFATTIADSVTAPMNEGLSSILTYMKSLSKSLVDVNNTHKLSNLSLLPTPQISTTLVTGLAHNHVAGPQVTS